MLRFVILVSAVVVFFPLAIIGLFYHFLTGGNSQYFIAAGSTLSQSCNVFASRLLDKIMTKDSELAPFGNQDETISGVLGKNHKLANLSKFGRFVRSTLNKLDPDHTENAIEYSE